MNKPTQTAKPYYRIDSFLVPVAARTEFLARVHETHAVLRQQDGFRQDFIVEQHLDEAKLTIVTVAEWDNEDVVANARKQVQVLHAKNNFDPQQFFARLGIKAEMGNYRPVAE
ncbi:antibiotic biosynthesis monooxygenase [Mesorhizobium sp. NBSH29]|uniref:antibiotic biosynthesis monooxygenase n=1 Tax=Mesorhizobium sp. NBSH29 TaxID=2654249 RepID=UPI0018967732|nr:antibiotic biosynthesis monooxygenase [Mesorhizobium sp. NBSH29]QPC88475.1 antibiotic biosynthesis monooxygenase [Mesorhizobium sp. NBSH29]